MSTQGLKKWALLLTFWVALQVSPLRAQTLPFIPTGGGSGVDFELQSNGTFLAEGTFMGGTLSASGPGTRFIWFPGGAALRAGSVTGSQWDAGNVGLYSVAMGLNTTASGTYAVAMGDGSSATGTGSTALGMGALASQEGATASGYGARAPSWASTAFGISTWAGGVGSVATGIGASTSGEASTASGYFTLASGAFSSAFGLYTSAQAFNTFVIGTYNVGGGTPNSSVTTDPAFEIGNGTSSANPSDALVVYKNGNAVLQGSLQVAPAGDIPMYAGH